jgi:hypothetical protein
MDNVQVRVCIDSNTVTAAAGNHSKGNPTDAYRTVHLEPLLYKGAVRERDRFGQVCTLNTVANEELQAVALGSPFEGRFTIVEI